MYRTRFIFGITALFLMAGVVVIAQQGHGAAPKPTHPTSTAPKAAPSPTSKATKPLTTTQPKTMKSASAAKSTQTTKPVKPAKSASATTAKAPATKSAKTEKPATTKLAKADKPAATKVAKAEKPETTKVAKAEKSAKTSKPTASTTTATTTTGGTTTGSTTPLTPVQEKLKKNTNLAAKLTSRLPDGTDLMTASADFRSLGQFVAAVNVSNNLGISFTQLKTKMVTEGMSLGQAIQAVRPLTASATVEAQHAEYDARSMIAESEQQPQPTATTATSSSTSSKSKAKAKKPAQ